MGTRGALRQPEPTITPSLAKEGRSASPLRWILCAAAAAVAIAFDFRAGAALVVGLVLGLAGANPSPKRLKALQGRLLGVSVALMGAGLDFNAALAVGSRGVALTAGLLVAVFLFGWAAARALKLDRDEALLVTAGTAICGGSAIAALSAVIKPKESAIAYALAVVFLLNAVALVLLPPLGHLMGMSESQFGWWAALAIHDTSSVVGATMAYGSIALALGTTAKLARALWIVPVTAIVASRRRAPGGPGGSVRWSVPWFLPAFLVLSALFTMVPQLEPLQLPAVWIARRGIVLVLFLVGLSLDREIVGRFPPRLAAFGFLLWVFSLVASLGPAWVLGAR